MEKKLNKQILASIAAIVDEADGYQVAYTTTPYVEVSYMPKKVTEKNKNRNCLKQTVKLK